MSTYFYSLLFLTFICLGLNTLKAQIGDSTRIQNSIISLEEVKLDTLLDKNKHTIKVNVATRTSIELENTPGSVIVITRAQLDAMNLRTLRQVLNVYVPGLDALPTNFSYGSPNDNAIYTRGNNSDFAQQVLILFNGATKFNESTFGSAQPTMEFTLDNIERIEVSTTPTTVYGANAITVINLLTHEQFLDGAQANVNYGINPRSLDQIFQNQRYTVSWGNTLNKIHVGASLQYYKDEGQFHNLDDYNGKFLFDKNTLKDGTPNAVNLTLHLKDIGERFEAGLWYKNITKDPFLNGFTSSQSNDLYYVNGQQFLSYFKYTGKKITFNIGGLFSEYNLSVDRDSLPTAFGNRNNDIFAELGLIRKVNFWGHHEIAAGFRGEVEGQHSGYVLEWKKSGFQTVKNPAFVPNLSRLVLSAFVEDNWKFKKKTYFLLGARADYFIGYKNFRTLAFNPRVAIVQHFGKNFTAKAVFARSFRAPTIYELYGTGYKYLEGNSNIKPEVVTSVELNAVFRNENLQISLTPFLQVYENHIQFIASKGDTGKIVRATNLDRQRTFGLELDTRVFLNSDRTSYLFLNGSYLIPGKDNEFLFIPKTYLGGGGNFVSQKWNFNFTAYYRGIRSLPTNLVINQKYNGFHFVGSISVSCQFNSYLNVYTLLENLSFNRQAVPLAQDGFAYPLRTPVINIGIKISPF